MSKMQAATVAGQKIKSYVDRVEKLEEERKAIGGDIRDVYAEAKGNGYDVKTLRWLVQERKIQAVDRDERDALRDTYAHALDMAVHLVQVEGLSLREAAKRTGTSKSSVHRALAVPQPSHNPDDGEIHDTAEEGQNQGAGQGPSLGGQPDSQDAGGDAADAGGPRHGQDDRGEDGEGFRGEPAPQSELTREAATSGDDAGHRSEPSSPAEVGNPTTVNADPPLGQQPSIGNSQGEQSGINLVRADASDCEARDIQESCGGVESRHAEHLGPVPVGQPESVSPQVGTPTATRSGVRVAPDPHDTHSETHHGAVPEETNHPPQDAPPAIMHASDCAVHNEPALPAGPCDCGAVPGVTGSDEETGIKSKQDSVSERPVGGVETTSADTRGEARPNPDIDDLKIPAFLRRPRERVMESALPRSIHASEA